VDVLSCELDLVIGGSTLIALLVAVVTFTFGVLEGHSSFDPEICPLLDRYSCTSMVCFLEAELHELA